MKRLILGLAALVPLLGGVGQAKAGLINLAIVEADPGDVPVSQLMATGLFSNVTDISASNSTPTLAQLNGFDAVLAYTNFIPADGTALGNVLAQYADEGHQVTLATYSFSDPWAIGGQMATPGYSPLVNLGVNGDVSGNLVAVNPSDPMFNGINLSNVVYFHNGNFAHPGLDSGATLLATDGSGIDMIARNSKGNIVGFNLFPGAGENNNSEFYQLLGQTLEPFAPPPPPSVPEPASLTMLSIGALCSVVCCWRRRRQSV